MLDRKTLEGKTLAELRDMARRGCHKYRGYSKHTKKSDLITFMLAQDKKSATPKRKTPAKKATPKRKTPAKKRAPKRKATPKRK